jgi:hypothetical protein
MALTRVLEASGRQQGQSRVILLPAYVMVMQNINRELYRRLRRADNRITALADASRECENR